MEAVLSNALHIFIIIIFSIFLVGCVLAVNGQFDNWTSRYIKRPARRKVKRPATN